ncbi:hypothetical protein [Actinomycetospora lemnae]|uniref:Mce-associated membrane protein n=1 Tax=Actinomycetospora lemnae TaxID=3019891 RepID=A0ABT5ST66_9PSEU|nr:hypothetical protein [Actinomycetospora sp. DW7H6]MDD7966044.1 hypothetical protein [Actinomycetospora sp. DW7H6]
MPPRSRTKPGSTARRPKVAGLRQHAHAGAGAGTVDPVDAPDLDDRLDAPLVDDRVAPEPETAPDDTELRPTNGVSATTATSAPDVTEAPAHPATDDEPDVESDVESDPVASAETTALPAPATEEATEAGVDTAPDAETDTAPASMTQAATAVTEADEATDAEATGATETSEAGETTEPATATVTTPRPKTRRGTTRMRPRAETATKERPVRDGDAAAPTRAAKPTRTGGKGTGAPSRFERQRAALTRFAGSRALPVVLVVVTVLCLALGGLAFWKGRQAWTSGPVSNGAVVDVGGTAELVGQSREAIEKIFSYDFSRLDDSADAARTMSTGQFAQRYMAVFDQTIRQPAQQQQLKQTATVVNIGVTQMRDDRATVMALTQFSAQRTTTGQSTNAPGLLRLEMERVDGRWKLAELTPLTAQR